MKYCGNCGSQIEDTALFCNKCGTKAAGVPAQTAYQPVAAPQSAMQDFTAPQPTMQSDTAALPAKKKSNHLLFIFLLVIFAIAGCVMLWWFLFGQYRTQSALHDANDYAKYAYEAAEKITYDAAIYGEEQPQPFNYKGPVSDIPEDNAFGKAIKQELESADAGGYVCVRFHPYDREGNDPDHLNNFVQWSAKESGAVIGQCPTAPTTAEKALEIEFGKYVPLI